MQNNVVQTHLRCDTKLSRLNKNVCKCVGLWDRTGRIYVFSLLHFFVLSRVYGTSHRLTWIRLSNASMHIHSIRNAKLNSKWNAIAECEWKEMRHRCMCVLLWDLESVLFPVVFTHVHSLKGTDDQKNNVFLWSARFLLSFLWITNMLWIALNSTRIKKDKRFSYDWRNLCLYFILSNEYFWYFYGAKVKHELYKL